MRNLSIALLLTGLVGCSGGGGGSSTEPAANSSSNSTAPTQVPPNYTSGRIVVTSVLLRGIPSQVDGMVFRGLDAAGQQIYGPIRVAKSVRVVMEGMPTALVRLEIDYLEESSGPPATRVLPRSKPAVCYVA